MASPFLRRQRYRTGHDSETLPAARFGSHRGALVQVNSLLHPGLCGTGLAPWTPHGFSHTTGPAALIIAKDGLAPKVRERFLATIQDIMQPLPKGLDPAQTQPSSLRH